MKGACGHPVVSVVYVDDLTGEQVVRLRCERCAITYPHKERDREKA